MSRHGVTVRAVMVPVDKIRVHSHNVRRDLGDLRSLAASIKRYGVMQPVIVEDQGADYRLRAGHRRVAAARIAGLSRVPALVHDEMLEDEDWLIQAIHENTKRRGMDHRDRADAITALRRLGCTWDGIAEAFDVTPATARSWCADKHSDSVSARDESTQSDVATAQELRRQGRSYSQIADQMGVSAKQVDRWLNGVHGPGSTKRNTGPGKSYVVAKGRVRDLIATWRDKPEATAADVLDALADLVGDDQITRQDDVA